MNRKITAAACAIMAIGFALTACSGKKKNSAESADPSKTIIRIGDQAVSFASYKALFDNYLPYMQYYGQDPLESESALTSYQDWLVDELTNDLVTVYQAKSAGFKLSDKQEKELKEQTETEINELYDRFMKFAEQSHDDDPSIPVETYFDSIVNEESEYYTGVAMSWEDYKSHYYSEAEKAYIVNAYKESVCREFVPSENDITNWYDAAYENDKANYIDSPEKYKNDEENFEMNFGAGESILPVTFVPEGYSRIMHIVVSPKGELSDEYKAKLKRMEEIKTEYSELAFEDALNGTNKNAGKLASLLSEYKLLKQATEGEYSQYVEEAYEKIRDAYKELASGKPFAEVMAEYTEDKRVVGDGTNEGCETFRTKGELISLRYNGLGDWSEKIKEEFGKLSMGSYSGIFMDGGSYHIVYYASDERSGDVPLEEIHDYIKEVCMVGVRNSQWNDLLSEWKKDPELKIDYDTIRLVGAEEIGKE